MANISSLVGSATTAVNLSSIILATPNQVIGYQPQNPPNSLGLIGSLLQTPPGFVFQYEGEQTVSLESDITDHYVEDNSPIQDNIALRPELITTHGYIGELNNAPPGNSLIISTALDKLTAISAYAPGLSASALYAYAQAFQLYQAASNAVNSATSLWSSLTGGSQQNQQQTAFQTFYGYWTKRTLFTVQTPWAVFQNCALSKLRAIQDSETNVITDFELTFKVIRMASSQSLSSTALGAARYAAQSATGFNLGSSTPQSSTSVSTALTGGH